MRTGPDNKAISVMRIRAQEELPRVLVVGQAKKQEEKQHYQTMRKTQRLFQYKYYREQVCSDAPGLE